MFHTRRLFMQKGLLLTLIALMFFMTGCANSTKFGAAKINSSPEGAEVVNLRDNSHLGVTPVNVSFTGEADSSEYITIQLRKNGYKDRITSFWINKRHDTALAADDNAIDISVSLEKN